MSTPLTPQQIASKLTRAEAAKLNRELRAIASANHINHETPEKLIKRRLNSGYGRLCELRDILGEYDNIHQY